MFSNKFKHIESFEPIKEITYRLSALNKNIRQHHVALSNKIGNLKFYIPIINGTLIPPLATWKEVKTLWNEENFSQKIRFFKFTNVDLIKIDVEGHEYKLIEGAIKTIKKNYPLIICEIEQHIHLCQFLKLLS